MKSKFKNKFCVIAGLLALSGGFTTLSAFSRLAYSGELGVNSLQTKILGKLSKLEKKTLINPILENLASTLEKNQNSLQDVADSSDPTARSYEGGASVSALSK